MNLLGNNFIWWVGVVEDRKDPEKLGRCRVRIFGHHTSDLAVLPTNKLPWAVPLQPITSAANSGVGTSPVGPVEGTWVIGWFLDDDDCQQPIMMGTIAGKNEEVKKAKEKTELDNLRAGNYLTTSNGSIVRDGSGNPIVIGSAEAQEYTTESATGINPANPSCNPAGPLNDPSMANAEGFKDPSKVYPKADYSGKPDTNKLATSDKTHKMFARKEKIRKTGVKTAVGSTTWDEPKTAYAAKYPYNHVFETEAGHVLEFDSTPNQERIHLYHKTGTYVEVDLNGTVVKKTVGDDYEIMDRNGFVYVKGAYNLTVDGTTKILVQSNADIQVDGDTTLTSHGSTLVQAASSAQIVAENIQVNAKSSLDLISDGPVNIQGSQISLKGKSGPIVGKANKIAFDARETGSFNGGLSLLLDASVVKTKMGHISVATSSVSSLEPPEKKTIKETIYGKLSRPDSESLFLGDSLCKNDAVFSRQREAEKTISTDIQSLKDVAKTAPQDGMGSARKVTPTKVDTSEFGGYDKLPGSLKLSKYFNLEDLTTGTTASSYELKAQAGLSKEQIAGNLKHLAVNVLDKVKEQYPDMVITSGFRSKNESSDHDKGQAADLQFTGRSISEYYDIARWIRDNTPYRQVLLEYAKRSDGSLTSWIHVAASPDGGKAPMPIGTLVNHTTAGAGAKNKFVNYGSAG